MTSPPVSDRWLAQLRNMLPTSPAWDEWLAATGELPPDFSALSASPDLPDQQREHTRSLLTHWWLGSAPPPPAEIRAEVTAHEHTENAALQTVRLTFGPDFRAALTLELLMPLDTRPPRPVLMTQRNHREWALLALRRGFIGCVYHASDGADDADSLALVYPDYDWSLLTRRAWAASRCVDYLLTRPEINPDQIALAGHSRNGKQALIAAAYDPRIALVISSSAGAGGAMTARLCAEPHFAEGIEALTRCFPRWFHPRLRFFVGNEHRLPVDMHDLIGLIAPRPCLISTAFNDPVETTWGAQQTYRAVRKVYEAFGAADKLRILWRSGGHETDATLIERYLDWCEAQFNGGASPFEERFVFPVAGGARPLPYPGAPLPAIGEGGTAQAWDQQRAELRARIDWMFGDAPPRAANPGAPNAGHPPHLAGMLERGPIPAEIERHGLLFGEYIQADVYAPKSSDGPTKLPAVLWLHPFSFATGYAAHYRLGEPFHLRLAQAGFAVFCFDHIGMGSRVLEAEHFYRRYPDWSLLGKMARDALAAVEALAALPYVDADRIVAVGYSLGGLIGLHLGVLESRLAGLAVVCVPQPFRADSVESPTGGLRQWADQVPLLPRLAAYIGREAQAPYDVEHLIAAYAPRPLLAINPRYDRFADSGHVHAAVEAARAVYRLYGAADALTYHSPDTYNQFNPDMQDRVIDWLRLHTRPI